MATAAAAAKNAGDKRARSEPKLSLTICLGGGLPDMGLALATVLKATNRARQIIAPFILAEMAARA